MGKARRFSDAANDTVYQSETNSENYAMGSQQNPYNLGSVHFSDQSGIGNFSQAGTDQRKANIKGALFQGNIGFDLQTALLDTNTKTIDLNNDSAGTVLSVISTDRFVTLDSGTTGTLTTITGAQRPGQRLRLYNTTINTITITHTAAATVNTIRTPNASNLSFPGNGVLDLTWDITSAQWRVVGNVGGSGGVSFPIDFPEIDLGNVSGVVDIDWALSTRHAIKFTMTGNTTLTFSGTTSDTTEYSNLIAVQDGTGGWTLTLPVGTINASTVEAGILLDPDDETGIVVKFSFSTFYAFLETGNVVSGGGSQTPWLSDINASTFDLISLDRLLFSQTAGESLTSTITGITSDLSGNLAFNIPENQNYNFMSNALSILSLDNSSTNLALSLFARDDEIPILQLTRIDSTPTVGTEVGRTVFAGVDSTGVTIEEFARITVDSEDLTIGAVDGSMHLQVDKNSSTTAFLSLNNSNDNKVSIWKNLFMQTGTNIELNSNRIYSTITSNDTFIDGDSLSFQFFIDDTSVKATFGTSKLLLANDYFLQTQVVEHRDLTSDPSSPLDGSIWYNSTADKLRGRENSITFDLNSGAAGANTALSNLTNPTDINQDLLPDSAAVRNLGSDALRWGNCYFGRIVWPVSTSPIAAEVNIVNQNDDMKFNVSTGNTFLWVFQAGGTQMELSSTELILDGVNLDMENNNITDSNQIQLTGSSGDTVRGFFSASSGFLDISEDENSGTIRMFAKTAGGASNNMVDIDGGTGLVTFGQGGIVFGSSPNQPTIVRSGNDLNYNVASGAEINLEVASNSILNITSSDVNVNQDLDMNNNITVDWATTQSTVGAAGGASSLPATPITYIVVKVNGTERVIPAYLKS